MRKITWLLLLLIHALFSSAQQAAAVDSMKKTLANAKTTTEKIESLDVLSRTLMNVNLKEAEEYGKQLIAVAEESRDRAVEGPCFYDRTAAVLVPLHHWLEHKVIKYLTSHNRLTASGKTLLSKVFIRKKSNDEKSKT
jgi:hypothetical protein